MRKVWTLPYSFTAPAEFPAGFIEDSAGLHCTIPRNSRTLRRRQWVCDPIHVRRLTAAGNLVVSNQRRPYLRAVIARGMEVSAMAAALAAIEVRIDQSCLRDLAQFFAEARPWRTAWRPVRVRSAEA